MLGLVALGVLDRTKAFPTDDVTEDLVIKNVHIDDINFAFYGELIQPLKQKGRHDLAQAINRKTSNFLLRNNTERKGLKKLKKRIRRWKREIKVFDSERLNGNLYTLKRILSRKNSL
jgi:hypothetical protein